MKGCCQTWLAVVMLSLTGPAVNSFNASISKSDNINKFCVFEFLNSLSHIIQVFKASLTDRVTDKGRQWSDSGLKNFLSNPLNVKRDVNLRGRSNGHEVCLISFYGPGECGGLSGFWVAFWWVTFGQSKFPGLNMFGKRYLWNRDSDHDVESIH